MASRIAFTGPPRSANTSDTLCNPWERSAGLPLLLEARILLVFHK